MARMNRVSLKRKKELEKPDRLLEFLRRLAAWTVAKRFWLLSALGAVVLVGLISSGLYTYFQNTETEAFDRLAAVEQQLDRETAENVPPATRQKQYKPLSEKYAGTMAGKMAAFRYADACYEAGQYEQARAVYKKLAKAFKDTPFFENRALSGWGYAAAASGQTEQAIRCFEKITADPRAVLKDFALFQLARLYQQTGSTQKSRQMYATLARDYPDSIYAPLAREKSAG